MSALHFTRKEIQAALDLYFEPLHWIRRAVQKLRNHTKHSSTDVQLNEIESLRTTLKERRWTSVSEDWKTWLPVEKAEFFASYVQQLEAPYAMLSISLNEALELRRAGQTARARQAIALMPSLCVSLTDPLHAILRGFLSHARKFGTVPNVAPLDEANFRGKRSQRVARLSSLLTVVLLTKRSLFSHKIVALEEMIGDIAMDVRVAAEEVAAQSSICPDAAWIAIDNSHFDLNTCVRETIVVLKSFLVSLPEDQLRVLEGEINRAWQWEPENEPISLHEHRRWTPLTSEEIAHAKKAS